MYCVLWLDTGLRSLSPILLWLSSGFIMNEISLGLCNLEKKENNNNKLLCLIWKCVQLNLFFLFFLPCDCTFKLFYPGPVWDWEKAVCPSCIVFSFLPPVLVGPRQESFVVLYQNENRLRGLQDQYTETS